METRQSQDKPNLSPLKKSIPPNQRKRTTFSMMAIILKCSSNPMELKSGSFAIFALSLINKRAKKSIGPYPPVTLADARSYRAESHSLIAKQIDPQEHQQEQLRSSLEAKTNTFQLVAELWWNVRKASVTEDYAEDTWRSLERDVFPAIVDLALQISKLIRWFRLCNKYKPEVHWKLFVACASASMRS